VVVQRPRLDGASAQRVLPGGAFDWRLPLGALSATMGLLILSSSPSTFVPYILRTAHGVAPVIGGYANATYALSWTLVSFLTASAARGGARMAIRIGPLFMCAGMALLAWAVPAGTVLWVTAAHALMGAGIGMASAHIGALLIEVAPASDREAAGPFITTTQTLAAVRGFFLLPRRWVVERSFARATRCRRLVKDYERYDTTLAGLHVVAFVYFMLKQAALRAAGS
jgi:hypothetical protein